MVSRGAAIIFGHGCAHRIFQFYTTAKRERNKYAPLWLDGAKVWI
jgi:hypothetical protein